MADRSTGDSDSLQNFEDSRLPPPSGSYVTVIIGELSAEDSKELILERIVNGFKSWNEESTGCNINEELQIIVNQAAPGIEKHNGGRHIQHGSDNIITEILINPEINFLCQSLKNLFISHTKHKHIIYVGHAWEGTGSWILQDDNFTFQNFAQIFHDTDVDRILKKQAGSSLHLHCFAEGEWSTSNCSKQDFGKVLSITVNPEEKLSELSGVIQFSSYIGNFITIQSLTDLLQPSDIAGNIRYNKPTLYIFPAKQGDSALFGIGGFSMLFDGGFGRKACFWDFSRHLDRIDALMISSVSEDNLNGIGNVLKRKVSENVYPQIGCAFFNGIEPRQAEVRDSSKHKKNGLLLSLIEEGASIINDLKYLGLKTHTCYRNPSAPNLEPINLYHKVGYGTLDMYILNPVKDSKEHKDFTHLLLNQKKNFASHKVNVKFGGKDVAVPLSSATSICSLLVWSPESANDKVTRILFPGNCPQQKIFEALEKAKNMDLLKYPVFSDSLLLTQKAGKARAKNNTESRPLRVTTSKPASKVDLKKTNGIQLKSPVTKMSKTNATGTKTKFEPKIQKEEINKKAAEMNKKPDSAKLSPTSLSPSPPAAIVSPYQPQESSSDPQNQSSPLSNNELSVKIDPVSFDKESPPSTPSTIEQDVIASTPRIPSNENLDEGFAAQENQLESTVTNTENALTQETTSVMTQSFSEITVDARDEFVFQGPEDNKPENIESEIKGDIFVDEVALQDNHDLVSLATSLPEPYMENEFCQDFEQTATKHGIENYPSNTEEELIDVGSNAEQDLLDSTSPVVPELGSSISSHDIPLDRDVIAHDYIDSGDGSSDPDVETEDIDVIHDHESLQQLPSQGNYNHEEYCIDAEEDEPGESDNLDQPRVIEILREELPSSHGAQAVEEYVYSTEESEQEVYVHGDSEPLSEATDIPEDDLIIHQPISDTFDSFYKSSVNQEDKIITESSHSEEKSEICDYDNFYSKEISNSLILDHSVESSTAIIDNMKSLRSSEISDFNNQNQWDSNEHSTDASYDNGIPDALQNFPDPIHNESSVSEDFFQHGGNQISADSDFVGAFESHGMDSHYDDSDRQIKELDFEENQQLREQMPLEKFEFSMFDQFTDSENLQTEEIKTTQTNDFELPVPIESEKPCTEIEKQDLESLTTGFDNETSIASHHIDPFEKWGNPLALPMPPPPDDSPDTPSTPVSSSNVNDQFPGVKKTKTVSKTSKGNAATRPVKKDSKNSSTLAKSKLAPKPELKDSNKRIMSARIEKTTVKTEIKQRPASAKAALSSSAVANNIINGNNSNSTKRAKSPLKLPLDKKPAPIRLGNSPKTSSAKVLPLSPVIPVYVDLTYIPHHGNLQYSDIEFFRKVRSRYYILSSLTPNRHTLDALLEAKQTWEDKQLEVTIIPTYDSPVLSHWYALNVDQINQNKISLAPAANCCIINLQDHETSCLAYRLEF